MKSKEQVDTFIKLLIQMESVLNDFSELSKKKPNDAVNKFKLRLVSALLAQANDILTKDSRPFVSFEAFDEDDLPSNSDVVLILSQYMGCLKKFGRDNTRYEDYKHYWVINGKLAHENVEWHRLGLQEA